LREENERLKNHSQQLAGQVQTLSGQCTNQKTTMDALKQELKKA
jgi:peptidoglycan hydrolase CwlO-like protein